MIIVTENPIVPNVTFEMLQKEDAGSVIFHYAVVKDEAQGKQTSGICFEKMETWNLNFHQLKMIL